MYILLKCFQALLSFIHQKLDRMQDREISKAAKSTQMEIEYRKAMSKTVDSAC